MDPFTVTLKMGVFQSAPRSVTNSARELFFFKMKLNYELCGADHVFRHLALVVFLQNRSEHFASLCSKISPAHIVCTHLCYKKGIGK